MIINYQPSSNKFWPNRSQLVANDAKALGADVSANFGSQIEEQDLIIWQYCKNTSSTDYLSIEQAQPGTRLVLWINNFSDFKSDNLRKQYLNLANYVVVPSFADRLALSKEFQAVDQIGVCEAVDIPLSMDLNGQVSFNNDLHRVAEKKDSSWQLAVKDLNDAGGFGLVDSFDEAPALTQLAIITEAGLPVVTTKGSPVEGLIRKYHLGLIVPADVNMAETVANQSEDVFRKLANSSWQFGRKLAVSYFTHHALVQAIFHATDKVDTFEDYTSIYTKNRFNLQVMDTKDTLDFIEKYHPSVTRFGDGEIGLINGNSQVFQDTDPKLMQRLDEIVRTPSDSHLLVCLSDCFYRIDNLVEKIQKWWDYVLGLRKDYYQSLSQEKGNHVYGNTMVTRPYIDYQDKSHAGEVFNRIKQWWQDRDVLLVEGYYTRAGVGNDLFDNARSVQRIICPSKNAWDDYDQIKSAVQRYGRNKLVLAMLGMTASVLAADLADWGQVIDLGHLDSEYEWYKMGATKKVPIPGKHTAEMNHDKNISDVHSAKYQAEIVLNISGHETKQE